MDDMAMVSQVTKTLPKMGFDNSNYCKEDGGPNIGTKARATITVPTKVTQGDLFPLRGPSMGRVDYSMGPESVERSDIVGPNGVILGDMNIVERATTERVD
ncbi:hypothetical protein U1Q18_037655 [Sarracenia purpurea var. burkii]